MRTEIALFICGTLVFGCGGATTTDAAMVNESDGGADGASVQGDGATNDGSGPIPGGPRGPDGSVVADGGSGTLIDAGPGGTTSSLPCGSTACLIPSESCCVTDTGNGFAFACIVGSTCPAVAGSGDGGGNNDNGGVAALKCTSAANCPQGTVCCVAAPNDVASSACLATCGPNDAQLCDLRAASTGCPTTAPCSSANIADWGLPASFATCGGKPN